MTNESPADKPAPSKSRSGVEGVVDDVFGFDFKLPRTVRDLVIRPGRVADAALAGDHSRYMRPLRMLLVTLGVQLLVVGWFSINDTGTFQVIYASNPAALATVEARLIEAGSSLAAADAVITRWTSWTSWPLFVVSSFLYVLVIWTTRPRLGLLKSALLYIVATSAGNVVSLPALPIGGLMGPQGLAWGVIVGFVTLFVYAGLVMHRRAADTAFGLAMRIVAFVLATIPVFLVGGALVFGAVEIAFQAETGLSRVGLIAEAGPPEG